MSFTIKKQQLLITNAFIPLILQLKIKHFTQMPVSVIFNTELVFTNTYKLYFFDCKFNHFLYIIIEDFAGIVQILLRFKK